MKEYHTSLVIDKPAAAVWKMLTDTARYPDWNPLVGRLVGELKTGNTIETYIVPLGKSFFPKLLSVKPEKELIWQGKQVAKFLLAGKHYYRLEALEAGRTKLLHGEYFTGLLSPFISKKLLKKMEDNFHQHNLELKLLVEDEG
ncbi:MAG: SRPBCC domain-containing protein [Bacteroidota bacterium]